ncbi:MAG: SGNH/GDSL hydrolase family protein [Clostridia bacterium]|nr:SGNH/GDSL hydrolase family protein [Clostridia bacterium]
MNRVDMRGLNVLALGDSLFSGTPNSDPPCVGKDQWVNLLGISCGWNLSNLGIGGMTVSLTANNAVSGNQSMYDWLYHGLYDYRWGSREEHPKGNMFFHCGEISGKPEDVELILLEGGNNDYGYKIAAPLGEVDSEDPATFLGAWNLVTARLLEQYPNALILFITPWELNGSQARPDGMASIPYTRGLLRLYEARYAGNSRVALIDAGKPEISGVDMNDPAWKQEYSFDNYHLKPSGMKVIAERMLPLIELAVADYRARRNG